MEPRPLLLNTRKSGPPQMTPPNWNAVLAVAAGGAVGSAARYLVGMAAASWAPGALPWGTLLVNLLGCFAIGALSTAGDRWQWAAHPALVAGLLGGFTTFSAFGLETVRLTTQSQHGWALANVALHVILGLTAVWAGMGCVRAVVET